MKHQTKRIWDRTSKKWATFCPTCEEVYDEGDIRAGLCPAVLGTTCNMCLDEMKIPEDGKESDAYGLEAKVSAGFYSPVLPDGYEYKFRICESCLVRIFETFEKPVERKAYMGGEEGEHRWHDDPSFTKDTH